MKEKVQIVNISNGERFETYTIVGERGSGQVGLNGPAARKCRWATSSLSLLMVT